MIQHSVKHASITSLLLKHVAGISFKIGAYFSENNTKNLYNLIFTCFTRHLKFFNEILFYFSITFAV